MYIYWGVKADNFDTFMCRPSGKYGSLNILESFTSRIQKADPLPLYLRVLSMLGKYAGIVFTERAITACGCQGFNSRSNHPMMNTNWNTGIENRFMLLK